MKCDNCGSDHHVVAETRLAENDSIARFRVCKHCGKWFTTKEIKAEVSIAAERRKFVRKTPRDETFNVNLNTLWEIWKC